MKRWVVQVGEIEHDGDIELTVDQIRSAGGKNVRCLKADFDAEIGAFSFEHELKTWLELRPVLEAAEVCL